MKKVLTIVGFFLLLFVGNISMSMAQSSAIYATEGETVSFDLVGMFWDGSGEDKIVKVWVEDPLLGITDLTTIGRYVLIDVQREQAGPYRFCIQRLDGRIEMWIINLIVRSAEAFVYLNEEIACNWKYLENFVFYSRKDYSIC